MITDRLWSDVAALAALRGVPDLEPSPGRPQICRELVVEVLDLAAELDQRVVEPPLGVTDMELALVPRDRGAAFQTRHVTRLGKSEHVGSLLRCRETIGMFDALRDAPSW
jgi:hypothetical protein